jgi:signal transduction histidine kinase
MSLRAKILLILLCVAGSYALLDNGLLRFFATRSFAAWELDEAEESMGQAVLGLQRDEQELRAKCSIWAHREDVLRLARDGLTPGSSPDLGPAALAASDVDFLYLCRPDGAVLARAVRPDLDGRTPRIDVLPAEALSPRHFLLSFEVQGQHTGWVFSDQGPLLVSAQPLRGAQGDGLAPPDAGGLARARDGVVILGHFADADFLARSVARSRSGAELSFSIRPEGELDAASHTPARAELLAALQAGESEHAADVGPDGRLHVFHRLADLRTGEGLLLEGSTERTIYARGLRYVRYALLSTVAATLVLLLVLVRLLQGIVIQPLARLTRKAIEIGRTDDTTMRVGMQRADEIGQLATEFDQMLEKLALSRAEVVRTARRAGMSEIATGVLHNVGNVLNSVNVSASLIRSKLERMPIADLERLAAILREHERDLVGFVERDRRGKHLVPLVSELAAALRCEGEGLRSEVRSLETGIGHIADLVRSQQAFAGQHGALEYAALEHEIESALRMCEQAMGPLAGLEIVREYEPLPAVRIDKNRLLEILVNLVQNARQALEAVQGRPRRLTLRLRRHGADQVRIEVEDNGVGIPAENLTRIFQHGFSTRPGGHGFGLHVSANAATEMKARLSVESGGPGQGAVFRIDLPLEVHVDPKLAAA